MRRYRVQVTLLLDRLIDAPQRSVEAVVQRGVSLVPHGHRAAGMIAVDGFACALHVDHAVESDRAADELREAAVAAGADVLPQPAAQPLTAIG